MTMKKVFIICLVVILMGCSPYKHLSLKGIVALNITQTTNHHMREKIIIYDVDIRKEIMNMVSQISYRKGNQSIHDVSDCMIIDDGFHEIALNDETGQLFLDKKEMIVDDSQEIIDLYESIQERIQYDYALNIYYTDIKDKGYIACVMLGYKGDNNQSMSFSLTNDYQEETWINQGTVERYEYQLSLQNSIPYSSKSFMSYTFKSNSFEAFQQKAVVCNLYSYKIGSSLSQIMMKKELAVGDCMIYVDFDPYCDVEVIEE